MSSYYLYSAINYRFVRQGIGPTFWNKQFWFVSHLAAAVAHLVMGLFNSGLGFVNIISSGIEFQEKPILLDVFQEAFRHFILVSLNHFRVQ